MRHIALRLESPLMSFGGETVDNLGVTRRFPAASMLTGLLANALGWRRVERDPHQRLQDRLVFAVRIDREPAGRASIQDFQTAQLDKNDRSWTTRGAPEGRAGGSATFDAPHLRYRDYLADMLVTVAFRLEPVDEPPNLDQLAVALQQPARPLFIGRKPCLPSEAVFAGFCEADTAFAALQSIPLFEPGSSGETISALWPLSEPQGDVTVTRTYALTDQRNWASSGLHGGGRMVCEGEIERAAFTAPQTPVDRNG
ncbi:MAG: type I-E CRISPR-associated protein Cas5/CasD [Chloroflexota bacterium]|nr:type I-E CRISPR-associated protein Cas5/CasD [Chloroflexota bacterium]